MWTSMIATWLIRAKNTKEKEEKKRADISSFNAKNV